MAANHRDWAQAFLIQAREDLKAARCVVGPETSSTFCMLLQMVFEKLAKAALAQRSASVPRTHRAATFLFQFLEMSPPTYRLPIENRIRQFVAELEEAQPATARRHKQPFPQLEYPWEDPISGKVFCPAIDLPLARRVRDPKDRIGIDCLKFATAVEERFSNLFP